MFEVRIFETPLLFSSHSLSPSPQSNSGKDENGQGSGPGSVKYHSSQLYRSCLEYSVADVSLITTGEYLEDGLEVSVIE